VEGAPAGGAGSYTRFLGSVRSTATPSWLPDGLDMRRALRRHLESYAARTPVRRVVAVGNAPLDPSVERAELIDSADLVFRCNSLVLDEPDDPPCLGRATHVVSLSRRTRPTPWTFRDYRSRAYLVYEPHLTRRGVPTGIPAHWPRDLGAWPIPNRELGIPLAVAMRPKRLGLGVSPTSGTLMAHVAHELFEGCELYLTGYSFLADRTQTEWRHHWGTAAPVVSGHKLDAEGAILQSWVDEGTATFVP
jgi:hypothetical protein